LSLRNGRRPNSGRKFFPRDKGGLVERYQTRAPPPKGVAVKRGWVVPNEMFDEEISRTLKEIEVQVLRVGGRTKGGLISKRELEEAGEIRVSIRPPRFLGSIELFTLRNLQPADYHLILVAIPRSGDQQISERG